MKYDYTENSKQCLYIYHFENISPPYLSIDFHVFLRFFHVDLWYYMQLRESPSLV